MPWELHIENYRGYAPAIFTDSKRRKPLGRLNDIQKKIKKILPTIVFWKEPTGRQKIHALTQEGLDIPPSLLEHMKHDKGAYMGLFEGDGASFEFVFGYDEEVENILLDVRGSGNPFPTLEALIDGTGWAIYDYATQKQIQQGGWETFTRWKDDALEYIRKKM